jgi:3-oxoacyl-[acyl-carrier protein] reductase
MPGDLEGKTALVTGGGKGIGRAICQTLAGMGARVVVNYRSDRAAAEETAGSLPGGSAHQADVGDPAQVEGMIKAVGRVDVLVNNAGAVRDKLLIQMSPPDWEDLIRTDLLSAFATTKAAIMSGMMRARWGRIVNISSIVGLTGNAGQSNYAAAKAGLVALTRQIAVEYAPAIRANVIAPGSIDTPRFRKVADAMDDPQAFLDGLRNTIPLQRLGGADDISKIALFLASDESAYTSGAVIPCDGGLAAYR